MSLHQPLSSPYDIVNQALDRWLSNPKFANHGDLLNFNDKLRTFDTVTNNAKDPSLSLYRDIIESIEDIEELVSNDFKTAEEVNEEKATGKETKETNEEEKKEKENILQALGQFKENLMNAQKQKKDKLNHLENSDPFLKIYSQLPKLVKESAEVRDVFSSAKVYQESDTDEQVAIKRNVNAGCTVRLKLILVNLLSSSTYEKLGNNDPKSFNEILCNQHLLDAGFSLNQATYQQLKQDSPSSYHYQRLHFLLRKIKPTEDVNGVFRCIDKVLYSKANKTLSEQAKLVGLEKEVLRLYYAERKKKQSIFASKALGDALELFIKHPAYLDLAQKYTFTVPHVVNKRDEAPEVAAGTEKRSKRVALIVQDTLSADEKRNDKLFTKIEAEYHEAIVFRNRDEIATYLQSQTSAEHIEFSVFDKTTNSLVYNQTLNIAYYKVTHNATENTCTRLYRNHPSHGLENFSQRQPLSNDYQEFAAALEKYLAVREGEENISNSQYHSFFGRITGMNAKVKRAAAAKLLNEVVLQNNAQLSNTAFSNDEIVALRDGRLGKLLNLYKDHLPNTFKIAEKERYACLSANRRGLW